MLRAGMIRSTLETVSFSCDPQCIRLRSTQTIERLGTDFARTAHLADLHGLAVLVGDVFCADGALQQITSSIMPMLTNTKNKVEVFIWRG